MNIERMTIEADMSLSFDDKGIRFQRVTVESLGSSKGTRQVNFPGITVEAWPLEQPNKEELFFTLGQAQAAALLIESRLEGEVFASVITVDEEKDDGTRFRVRRGFGNEWSFHDIVLPTGREKEIADVLRGMATMDLQGY